MTKQTFKNYECTECGHQTKQRTNHWGNTYSWGRYNTCPKCPPYKKYPEYGGSTVWKCLDQQKLAIDEVK